MLENKLPEIRQTLKQDVVISHAKLQLETDNFCFVFFAKEISKKDLFDDFRDFQILDIGP